MLANDDVIYVPDFKTHTTEQEQELEQEREQEQEQEQEQEFELESESESESDEKKLSENALAHFSYFCKGQSPDTLVTWKICDTVLKNVDDKIIFEQKGVEFPAFWSERAVRIAVQKYFYGKLGSPQREYSLKQLVGRVVQTIKTWAENQKYFASPNDLNAFCDDLTYLLYTQRGAFNSPVWFNLGLSEREPQVSACFINTVEDSLESISKLQAIETKIFKRGSGSGVNLSSLRSQKEYLTGGGKASGPVSFMRGLDAWAGTIKSGGATRRAASMRLLNVDHPDILDFIECKVLEEQKAHTLIQQGYNSHFDDPHGAYASVAFQNANHTVRVSDAFMSAVEEALAFPDREVLWDLKAVASDEIIASIPVRKLWKKLCYATWFCGDPGIAFDDTVNRWHTVPYEGRIQASNPCQPHFATVLTPEGIRTFADIDVGSTIWSGKEWTKVTVKKYTGDKDVYCYHTCAGTFLGTETHRVLREGQKIEVREAEAIDTVTGPAPEAAEPLDTQDVLDGLMLGDGSVVYANHGTNRYLILNIGDDDACYFQSEVAPFINQTPYDAKRHRVEGCTLSLAELPRTYARQIPQRFLHGTTTKLRGFLRGLYSANGAVCDQRVTLKASSFKVIVSTQQMLSALGIRSYYTTNQAHDVEFPNGTYTCKESYDLNISVDRARFRDLIGFIHPHKTERLNQICETQLNGRQKITYEIVAKEWLGKLPVWSITVAAEEHTYWTAGLHVANCSEFVHLDDSACNLASLNLMRFRTPSGTLDTLALRQAVRTFIIAQDILVTPAAYPTDQITNNSHLTRPLGLGYANLGAYLMSIGMAYDSHEGRHLAAEITSIISAQAYQTSAELAQHLGPFPAYTRNKEAMLCVIEMHQDAASDMRLESAELWHAALCMGQKHGFRNAQVTLLAPSGTIGFFMDCDTTGIEPESSLYRVKQLVGGGEMHLESTIIEQSLKALGYQAEARHDILQHLKTHQSLDECKALLKQHLPVFDCAIPIKGARQLSLDAHLEMTAAVQPFLSGAISKTMNIAQEATEQQVSDAFLKAWKRGIKNIAIYRNNCKLSQPLVTQGTTAGPGQHDAQTGLVVRAVRKRLSDHQTNCHRIKFSFGEVKGYLLVTPYEDTGMPGEIFIEWAKEGSTVSGLVDGWAQSISYGLQYGVPLEKFVDKFSHTKFEPAGFSTDPDIRFAHSIYDALMRKLAAVFLDAPCDMPALPAGQNLPVPHRLEVFTDTVSSSGNGHSATPRIDKLDGPPCNVCGTIMERNGANCHKCSVCGFAPGCG